MQWRHFLDSLKNPEWLEPLRENDVFADPPPPEANAASGTIHYPRWAASRYLARMAQHAPDVVLSIALPIRTDNQEVHYDLAQAALGMPAAAAAKWARVEEEWLKKGEYLFGLLPGRLGEVAAHLARGGEVVAAIRFVRILCAPSKARQLGRASRGVAEVGGRMDAFDYSEVLNTAVPPMSEGDWEATLELISAILDEVLTFERNRRKRGSNSDFSSIWRPAIEPHAQNHPDSAIRDVLISQLRDLSDRVVQGDPARLGRVVAILEGGDRKTRVHGRVALHVLRLKPDATLVRERLLDHVLLENTEFRHEYARLAEERFDLIPAEEREAFLQQILRGPPEPSAVKQSFERFLERPATEQEFADEVEHWKLRRLVLFRAHLAGSVLRTYRELVERFGEPEHPDFTSYMTTFMGPTSPKSSADLAAMSVDQIVEFLRQWIPPKGDWKDSREGLGRSLVGAVTQEPVRYAEAAQAFGDVPHVYLGHLMFAFRQALEKNAALPWVPVLALARAIVQHPRGSVDQREEEEASNWPRKTVADVIEVGLRGGVAEIPFELRTEVWAILEPLTRDTDPEEKEDAEHGNPVNTSINTVRGQALHAVFHYALWVRRHLTSGNEEAAKRVTLELMPEVAAVLETRLVPTQEPARSVRAVYGMWFPWIVLLDRSWAAENVGRIFDTEPAHRELRIAAWQGYFMRNLFDDVFTVLKDEYRAAIGNLPDSVTWKGRSPEWAEGLSEHLALLLWRGKESHEVPSGLLATFFLTAPSELRAHCLDYLGRLLSAQNFTVTDEIRSRLQRLWDWRLQSISALPEAERDHELDTFGWWFSSGKLDIDWSLRRCVEVVKLKPSLHRHRMVIERLKEYAPARPQETLACLMELLRDERSAWKICASTATRKATREILTVALASDSGDVRATARSAIDRLGSLGYLEFGELVGVRSPS